MRPVHLRATMGLVLSLFLGMGSHRLSAQVPPGTTVGVTSTLETISLSDGDLTGVDGLSLFSVLFAGRTALSERVRLGISGGFARGALTRPDGSEATLAGLTDTRVTLTFPLVDEFVVFSLVGVLPTGNSEQNAEEAQVANVIAADLLPFRVSHWGAGGGIGANIGFARPLCDIGIAVGVGYVVGREYNPVLNDEFAYRPGDALTVSAGVDRAVGSEGKAALQLSFQRYNDDQLDGRNLYQAGNRLQVMGTYAFPAGTGTGIAYGGLVHRGGGSLGEDPGVITVVGSPSQDLVLLGGGTRQAVGPGILVPDVSVRLFRRSDAVGQGYLGSLGIGYEFRSGRTTFVPNARAKWGSVDVQAGQSTAVTGFDVGLTVRFGGSRR